MKIMRNIFKKIFNLPHRQFFYPIFLFCGYNNKYLMNSKINVFHNIYAFLLLIFLVGSNLYDALATPDSDIRFNIVIFGHIFRYISAFVVNNWQKLKRQRVKATYSTPLFKENSIRNSYMTLLFSIFMISFLIWFDSLAPGPYTLIRLGRTILWFSTDIITVEQMLFHEIFLNKIKFLRKLLEKNLVERQESSFSSRIDKISESFRMLKDATEHFKASELGQNVKLIMLQQECFTSTLLTIIHCLDSCKSKYIEDLQKCVLMIFSTLLSNTIACNTALFVEGVSSEIDKIKLLIVKEYALNSDPVYRDTMSKILRIWDHRTLTRTMWRLFTIDGSLLFNYTSVLMTYVIFIIQFLNLLKL